MWDSEESYGDDHCENDGDDEPTDEIESSALLEEYTTWTKAVEKAVTALGKKRKSLQSELTKAEGAESTAARAQLLVSNLYMFQDGVTTATVNDWENDGKEVELTLDSTGKYDSASAEADALFSLVRKLKRGSKIVAELLEETDAAWEILSEAQLDLQSARGEDLDTDIDEGRLAIVKERLIRTSRTTKFKAPTANDSVGGKNNSNGSKRGGQNGKSRRERKPELGTPASNVRKLMSPGGCIVLVGRNRRGNEHLSMTVARGNDIWMHSRGCPGAHVIIQNRRGSPTVTDECLQFGADLAIFYSDLRNENKAEVTAAEPKHIQKPRGAPLGAVKLREEWKTFIGRPDQVPDELKEAREESGQTDEYHMFDKAKHRRRTKQVAEEDRAKRRHQQREKKNQR
jgi:predicted ribosome quality control (RQC) complex YloA/Tae2 family protein